MSDSPPPPPPDAAPNPQAIVPDNGPADGGTVVQITGTNLGTNQSDITQITIVGEPCISIQWLSTTAVNCTTTAHPDAGKGHVIVWTASGGESHHDLRYIYNFAPQITEISPRAGPIAGGTLVNITGRNFGDSTEEIVGMSLAGVPCISRTWVNGKLVQCVSGEQPDGHSGSGVVEVHTSSGGVGRSNRTQDDQPLVWTYNPTPLVNAVYPQSGPIAGGTPLTLIGNNLGTSLEDIVNVTVASVLCDTVEYISISELHCVTGRVLPQNLKKHADKPVVGPIVVTTVSGGRGDRFHDVRANANFTYNPPPVVTSVFPDEIYSTYATEVSIGGSNLGMSKEDIESVLIANHTCSLLHFIDPTSIICMWNHTLLSPTTTGRVLVKTKSGGSCISSNTSVTIRPGCSRAKDTQACALMECTWCSVTASCANDRDNCPAVCLRHGSRSSCERQSALDGCRWCATTAACLDGSDDCPRGCFLHRTQEACTATSALQDDQQCGWCPSTMACLDVAELSACPSDCSLAAGTHFSCGSLIILVMMTILVVVIGTGFWTVVYYVQRDEQLTNDLKRYARTLRPSSWLTSRQQEMGRSGSGVGGETDAGAMADDSQPLLNDSPELIHRRAPRPPLSPFSAYQRGKPTHGGAPFPSSTRRIAIGQHRIASPLIRASTPTSDTEDETQHAGVFNAAVDDITSLQDEPLLQPPSDHVDTQTTTATTAASKLASFFSRRDSVPPGTPPREDETEPPVRPSLNSTRLSTRSPPSTTLLSALVQSCEELQPLSASPSPSPTRYARSENEEQPQE